MPLKNKNPTLLRDPEYRRLGTVTLITGLNLNEKRAHKSVFIRNRSSEFCEFIKILNKDIDQSKQIRLIVDNYSTHSSQETVKYINLLNNQIKITKVGSSIKICKKLPFERFIMFYLPTHSSWLNAVERFFSKLERGYLRNLRVNSLQKIGRAHV